MRLKPLKSHDLIQSLPKDDAKNAAFQTRIKRGGANCACALNKPRPDYCSEATTET